eukprot:35335_1
MGILRPVLRSPWLQVVRRGMNTCLNYAPLTKIVATIGPVSENKETLQKVIDAGMSVMRVNFSHATYAEAELRMTNIRSSTGRLSKMLKKPFNMRASILDTQGPEIRTGLLIDDKPVMVSQGSTVVFTTNPSWRNKGTSEKMWINYEGITNVIQKGNRVLLDDGLISLIVTNVTSDEITCMAESGARVKSRRGVNLPGTSVDLPALSDKDKADIIFGIGKDMDYVAASFVRKASDVNAIRSFVNEEHYKVWPADYPPPQIISKIECMEAVDKFDDILAISDGIMVARGDLGVEVPMEQIINLQKWMVQQCNKAGKPVIVATQMLDSMEENRRPTRAEVSDVTNAVYDGADAVMLSGESAQGKFPVESVLMMQRIVKETENWSKIQGYQNLNHELTSLSANRKSESISKAAVLASRALNAQIVLVFSRTGLLARLIAKSKPSIPIICFCPNQKVGRQLALVRGVQSMVGCFTSPTEERIAFAIKDCIKMGLCSPGDTIVVVMKEDKAENQLLNMEESYGLKILATPTFSS